MRMSQEKKKQKKKNLTNFDNDEYKRGGEGGQVHVFESRDLALIIIASKNWMKLLLLLFFLHIG